jgi:protein TonB
MFQDLVASSAVRPSRGRVRALPVSIAVHGAVFAAIAALPLLRAPELVEAAVPPTNAVLFAPPRVAVVTPPQRQPPPVRSDHTTAPRAPRDVAATDPVGPAPALPMDISTLGTGDPSMDTPALCLHDCAPGGTTGAVVGTGLPEGDGSPDPGPPRRAGVEVTPPARLGGLKPVYPELARRAHVTGTVIVECTIDPSGRVVNAVVTRGHTLLDAAALDAVRTWTYRPTLIGGVPVAVLMTVTVSFTLN